MTVVRSLLGVIAGFAVFAVIVGFITPIATRTFGVENFESFSMSLLFAALGYTIVAATLGGFVTGVIARQRELPLAGTVGLLMVGMGFISMQQHGLARPGWYEMTIAGCGPVSALFGAGISRLTKR